MPYKSQNTHLDIPALQPCDNLSPIAEKGVKQLCYHSCSTDMIINQRHTCKNLGDTFFSHFWEMKTWEIFWTSKIQNKIDGWKASTLENTRGMEQCRRNLKSLTAFDTCVYCQGAGFFSSHEEERITGLLGSPQHPLHSQVQASCYRVVLL